MNEESINIDDVVEHDDGSSTIRMDLDEDVQGMLIKQGLQYLIDEMRVTDKVTVADGNEFSKENKTHKLTNDEANALFHFGFLYAIKAGMKGWDDEIRLKEKESIINHLLRLDDTVTRLTLEVAKLQEYNEYVNLSTPKGE
jgi:hypothetical protein